MYDVMNAMSHRKQLTGAATVIFFSMAVFQITAIASVSCSNFKTVFAVLLGASCLWAFVTNFNMYGKTYAMVGTVGPCGVVPEKSGGTLMQGFTLLRNIAPISSIIYIIAITISALLIFPVSLFEIFGVMIVGPYIGFIVNLFGNIIAAIIAFFIGRKYLEAWVLKTAKDSANFNICIKAVQYHELKAVMAVRLLYIPTGLKNYLLGAIPHVTFNTYIFCTLTVTAIFSAMNSVVGAMATNIVDLIHKPNLAEWLFIAFGLVALGGVMVLLYFTYIEILNDLKNEASNVDRSLMHDSDLGDVEEPLNPSGNI